MKKLISLLLASVMVFSLTCTVSAASPEATAAADALFGYGLFQGVGTNQDGTPDFDLDRAPNRFEAVTMLVRLLGKEEAALSGNWSTPFTDVVEWAEPYVGYAYTYKLTDGVSDTGYGGSAPVTAAQYITFVLRALEYDSNSDFQWDSSWELSDELGFTDGQYNAASSFTRGDVAIISNNALSVNLKRQETTLLQIIQAGSQSPRPHKQVSVTLTVSLDESGSTVSKDEKFGAALLNMNQEEFEALGFCLGDGLSVAFQNGYSLPDVPYFNGYYVRNGEPVVVAYPGDPYIRITLNNMGIWDAAGLKNGDSVTIKLEQEGKYLAIQEALGQVYSFDRDEYPSDEAFSNFRSFSAGDLKQAFLYRGASPVDNSRCRAPYVDSLLEKNGIGFVIDLADSEEDMEGYIGSADFASAYVKNLYDNGSVVLLDMGSAYTSDAYKQKVAQGLRAALDSEGPFYIHCLEGKDRTGFVCLLLEALAGAGYDEMLKDYMTTYENYFHVTQTETPDKYDAIADLYFVPFLEFLHGTDDVSVLKTADYREDAAAYLKDGGMTDQEITALTALITDRLF